MIDIVIGTTIILPGAAALLKIRNQEALRHAVESTAVLLTAFSQSLATILIARVAL